jgi:hypothetical protein
MERFKQLAGGSDTLQSGFEYVLGIGLSVDDHWACLGNAAFD